MKFSLFSALALPTLASATTCYTALLDPASASGASGSFQMEYVANSRATYTYKLDLTSFTGYASTCNPSNGLSYHAHSYWTNATADAGANALCGAAYTGGHYDPSLACSTASEDIKTSCVSLGRTTDKGYVYSNQCNSVAYAAGNQALCEVGDFSGKFGALKPTAAGGLVFEGFVRDEVAPFTANYKATDAVAKMWSSVVFHCKDDASRILCGNLVFEEGECAGY